MEMSPKSIVNGQVNRRTLLKAGSVAGAGLLLGGTPESFARGALQDTPKPGGTIRIATGADPVGLDPMISSAYSTALIVEHVYCSLMQYDKTLNEVLPDLAESVEVSDDSLTYRFTLRPDLKWHDGQPCTTEDVKFSIERQKDPATGSPNAYIYDEVAEVVIVDDLVIELKMNQVQGQFLSAMASPWASIVPKHVVEQEGDLQTTMVGTGPFKFVNYVPGSVVNLEKNPDFYVAEQPYIDSLEIHFISDPTSCLNAVLTKQVEMAQDIASKDFRQLDAAPGVEAIALEAGSCQWDYLGMNCTRAPFDNVLVRQAVAHAINRQATVDNVLFGLGTPLTGGIVPEWSWAHSEDLELYSASPDIERAKALLAEAGYADGFKTTIKVSPDYPNHSGQAAIHQESLKAVGIEAEIISLEWGTLINDVFGTAHDFDMQVSGWGGPFIDPDEFLYPEFHTDQGFNPQLFSDPEVDSLLEQARATMDQAERKALYRQVEELIFTAAPIAATFNSQRIQAQQDYVKGFTAVPTGMMRWVREAWLDQ